MKRKKTYNRSQIEKGNINKPVPSVFACLWLSHQHYPHPINPESRLDLWPIMLCFALQKGTYGMFCPSRVPFLVWCFHLPVAAHLKLTPLNNQCNGTVQDTVKL